MTRRRIADAAKKTDLPARTLTPTAPQARILRLGAKHLLQHGRPPTVRELMAATGIRGPNGVICHLAPLARKGWITRDGTASGIALVGARLSLAYHGAQGERLRALLDGTPPRPPRLGAFEAEAWFVLGVRPGGDRVILAEYESEHEARLGRDQCAQLAGYDRVVVERAGDGRGEEA